MSFSFFCSVIHMSLGAQCLWKIGRSWVGIPLVLWVWTIKNILAQRDLLGLFYGWGNWGCINTGVVQFWMSCVFRSWHVMRLSKNCRASFPASRGHKSEKDYTHSSAFTQLCLNCPSALPKFSVTKSSSLSWPDQHFYWFYFGLDFFLIVIALVFFLFLYCPDITYQLTGRKTPIYLLTFPFLPLSLKQQQEETKVTVVTDAENC